MDTIEEHNIDRRAFERFTAHLPIKFKANGHKYGNDVSVYLENASALGVMIATNEEMSLNDSVFLEVTLPDCKEPLILKGQVKWISRDESGMWHIGLKFHTIDLVQMSRLYKFVMPAAQCE